MKKVILLIIVTIISYMIYGIYREAQIRTLNNDDDELPNILQNGENNNNTIAKNEKQLIEKEYLGYEVSSRLEIAKINLNTNVLSKYTNDGLKVCASKYYGPDANEIGNYCIAGHNYQKENMFNHLIDLSVGDEIYLTDNKNGMVKYEVYDIYKVKPKNTKPLSQVTNGKREITLITCVNYSRNRLIIKAVEKKEQ